MKTIPAVFIGGPCDGSLCSVGEECDPELWLALPKKRNQPRRWPIYASTDEMRDERRVFRFVRYATKEEISTAPPGGES